MLKVLRKMRDFYSYEAWMVFVKQAFDKGKISESEYHDLEEEGKE